MADPEIARLLGQIDGKLDQVISSAAEHRADDTRRFTEVYKWLGKHDEEINKAKGAKSVILWIAGVAGGLVSAAVTYAMKIKGGG